MATNRDGIPTPKLYKLTTNETLTSFEAWKQNITFTLSLNPKMAPFLISGVTWNKADDDDPYRGLTDDAADAGANRMTKEQKVTQLELMLGMIAIYCPVITRSSIVDNSKSIDSVWQSIRLHFGFQTTGGRFLELADMTLGADERPEDLYQRIVSFVEDSLLRKEGAITHHGEKATKNERMSPTLENIIVMIWLKLVHKDLPSKVRTKYATELRSRTLASIKPEISLALDALLEDVYERRDLRAMRAGVSGFSNPRSSKQPMPRSSSYNRNSFGRQNNQFGKQKDCSLCRSAGRTNTNHFLSKCNFLSAEDKKFMARLRSIDINDEYDENDFDEDHAPEPAARQVTDDVACNRRVDVEPSPYLDAFFHNMAIRITVDSGATGSFIHHGKAKELGLHIKRSTQSANQADGKTGLRVLGETSFTVTRDQHNLQLQCLVVEELDCDVLGGTTFQRVNDVYPRVKYGYVGVGDSRYYYNPSQNSSSTAVCQLLRVEKNTTVWPGEFIEMTVPSTIPDDMYAVEPRSDNNIKSSLSLWPPPSVVCSVGNKVRVKNDTDDPIIVNKNSHVCNIRSVTCDNKINNEYFQESISNCKYTTNVRKTHPTLDCTLPYSQSVSLDPDNLMPTEIKDRFRSQLLEYDEVFNPSFPGYNNAFGPIKTSVNMGPVLPPQRKGRMPLYGRNQLVELQEKFDELENMGVFAKPEDLNIVAEYLNPSFLVKKQRGGHRLVTAFGDVGRYSKPQPSLMPNIDNTIRQIGQWKHIICTDLTKAYFQIPVDKSSLKFCGVVTPFKGVRVYQRSAMGLPGSETALEELMSRVIGDQLMEGVATKIADNLYCGGNTLDELYTNWGKILHSLNTCNLKLSSTQTVINPKSVTILGWVWCNGTIQASSHKIASLASCTKPTTVKQLRSYVGAYKILSRTIPHCSSYLFMLDSMTAGKASSDKLCWNDEESKCFQESQKAVHTNEIINIPQESSQLWIVTDGAVRKPGIASTLYTTEHENAKPKVAGYFSAKLKTCQNNWLPCEIEALCIAASIQHFSPYIIQSQHKTCVLTDSKPCVLAFDKLCRGEFSHSPRVSTFLSVVSRYQASIRHIKGINNALSDFGSRNPQECHEPNCQICNFIEETADCVVRNVNINDILSGKLKVPFTSRNAWAATQQECPDLRRTHSYLKQGTRPSKKLTKIHDVKRYLNVVTIGRDGVLVVKSKDAYSVAERIVVPRAVIAGLLAALHIKLIHPTVSQLKTVCQRYFYALDLDKAIEATFNACDQCKALQKFPQSLVSQSNMDPPEVIGAQFATDVINRERQSILIVREYITSFTQGCLISDEKHQTLRSGLIQLCIGIRPIDGPPSVIRADAATPFQALEDDPLLKSCNLVLEIGRKKNINKNPVAERAVQETEEEILKIAPQGGPISATTLAVAIANLNSKIRKRGLSSREMLIQRDQFSNHQIPMNDLDLITQQNEMKKKNHPYSEISKCPKRTGSPEIDISVGDLVYLYQDKNKHRARDRYLVVSLDGVWCNIRKFTGSQLRQTSYRVKRNECYKVPNTIKEKIFHPSEEDFEMDYSTHQESPYIPNNKTMPSNSVAPQSQQEIPHLQSSYPSTNQIPNPQSDGSYPALDTNRHNTEVPCSVPLTPPPVPMPPLPPLPDIPEEISPPEIQDDNNSGSQLQEVEEQSLMNSVIPSTVDTETSTTNNNSTRPQRVKKRPVTLKDYHLY